MTWVVSLLILGPFGPFPVNTMLRAGRQVRLQTQLLFAADHVVPPKTTGDVLEDEAQLSRRLAARTVRFAEDAVSKKKKPARQKVVMYRSYAQG